MCMAIDLKGAFINDPQGGHWKAALKIPIARLPEATCFITNLVLNTPDFPERRHAKHGLFKSELVIGLGDPLPQIGSPGGRPKIAISQLL